MVEDGVFAVLAARSVDCGGGGGKLLVVRSVEESPTIAARREHVCDNGRMLLNLER